MAVLFWGCILGGFYASGFVISFIVWRQEVREQKQAKERFLKTLIKNTKTDSHNSKKD